MLFFECPNILFCHNLSNINMVFSCHTPMHVQLTSSFELTKYRTQLFSEGVYQHNLLKLRIPTSKGRSREGRDLSDISDTNIETDIDTSHLHWNCFLHSPTYCRSLLIWVYAEPKPDHFYKVERVLFHHFAWSIHSRVIYQDTQQHLINEGLGTGLVKPI